MLFGFRGKRKTARLTSFHLLPHRRELSGWKIAAAAAAAASKISVMISV